MEIRAIPTWVGKSLVSPMSYVGKKCTIKV
jgi:hypothetical protein